MSIYQPESVAHRYAIGVLGTLVAASLQWLLHHYVGARIPFLFFLPAVIFVAGLAGRGPATLIMLAGLLSAALVLPPAGIGVESGADRAALLAYLVLAIALILIGQRMRITSRRAKQQFEDLRQLHELSARLPAVTELTEQLQLILDTLTRMHGTEQGLVSLYDAATTKLKVVAALRFSDATLETLRTVRAGQGACGLACLEQRRVIVEDTDRDPCFAEFVQLARQEGFRAVHSTPLLTHSGEILGAISTHFRSPHRPSDREIALADLCASKAVTFIERARAQAMATERDERFRTVLEASAVPFMILTSERDVSGTVVDFRWGYLNAAAAHVLQRQPDHLIGQRVSHVFPTAWDRSGLFEHHLAVIERGEVREFDIEIAEQGRAFHGVASPVGSSVAVWFADITERRLQEQRLREADRRKDEFVATLAHELRNPLAPIRQAALIARTPAATESQKRWSHEVIERQVHNMSLLLEDLLDVSRITRGTLMLRKQHTELTAVVEAAAETARPALDAKRHRLEVELPESVVKIAVDPLRLSQILSNLLTNAAKYTNPDGRIWLRANVSGSDLIVSVTDNGIGLAPEELGSIFGMFSQMKSAQDRSEGGLGIGLALTKGLVELHGGTIQAHSDGPGLGTRFHLLFPGAVTSEAGERDSAARSTPKPTLSRRVLVADDNRDAAESLATLLRIDGHDVALAHDGEAAYLEFQRYGPDVAILDIGMPRLSGYELARRIRLDPQHGRALLIAVTGWGQETDKAQAAGAGFDHHLTKPVDYSMLSELLQPNAARATLDQIVLAACTLHEVASNRPAAASGTTAA